MASGRTLSEGSVGGVAVFRHLLPQFVELGFERSDGGFDPLLDGGFDDGDLLRDFLRHLLRDDAGHGFGEPALDLRHLAAHVGHFRFDLARDVGLHVEFGRGQ